MLKCKAFQQYLMPLAGYIQLNNHTTLQNARQSSCNKAVVSQVSLVQKPLHLPNNHLWRRQLHVSSYFHGGSDISRETSIANKTGGNVSLESLTKVQQLMTLQVKLSA
jgi:hypothetical protein